MTLTSSETSDLKINTEGDLELHQRLCHDWEHVEGGLLPGLCGSPVPLQGGGNRGTHINEGGFVKLISVLVCVMVGNPREVGKVFLRHELAEQLRITRRLAVGH